MKEPLSLGFAGEFSCGPVYQCPICHQKLRTEKWEETNWQEWCFTMDGKRHFKNRCNFAKPLEKPPET